MPNHVTNIVTAPVHVIESMLNEKGDVDFNQIVPRNVEWPWAYISGVAEVAAGKMLDLPFSDFPPLAMMQKETREKFDLSTLREDDREQADQMVENYRKFGHLHNMDAAIALWGTKWNAYNQTIEKELSKASFETAWSMPEPVYLALSAKFPGDEIQVIYADEDTGSNCGTVVYKAGMIVSDDSSPGWSTLDKAGREKWTRFAMNVHGYSEEEIEKRLKEMEDEYDDEEPVEAPFGTMNSN